MRDLPATSHDLIRDAIYADLEKCTPEQQELFGRIFPYGPSDADLHSTHDLIRRTLIKNAKKEKEKKS